MISNKLFHSGWIVKLSSRRKCAFSRQLLATSLHQVCFYLYNALVNVFDNGYLQFTKCMMHICRL